MLGQERGIVHGPHEKHIIAERLVGSKAATVVMLDAAGKASITTVEHDIVGAGHEAGFLKDRPKRRANPLSSADRFVIPRLALSARCDARTAVAGALKRNRQRALRAALQFVERKLQRLFDQTAKAESPVVGRRHERHIEVNEQIVQTRRREIVAQSFEQRSRVAVCKSHFGLRERAV